MDNKRVNIISALAAVLMAAGSHAYAEPDRAMIALLREPFVRFPGNTVSKEMFFRIPEHVVPEQESQLNLALRGSGELWPAVSGVRVSVNGERLAKADIDARHVAGINLYLPIRCAVPGEALMVGWNRISLEFSIRQLSELEKDSLNESSWFMTKGDCNLMLQFERLPIFPELRRFPEQLVEEKLLQPDTDLSRIARMISPTLSILLPPEPANAHLRGCAIIGARLGQLDYLAEPHCRLSTLENWFAESPARNGVVIGTRDELASLQLPEEITTAFAALQAGEGLLAEVLLPLGQRRWVIASGADEAGLEKAVLTLGSTVALATLPPGPAAIRQAPSVNHLTHSSHPSHLSHLNETLAADPSLRNVAFLVPPRMSDEEKRMLFGLSVLLGSRTASSPVSWPEACVYGSEPSRLKDRTVLLLGSVPQWNLALPPATRLPLRVDQSDGVRIQGRSYRVSTFEPSLVFVQSIASPWDEQERLFVIGGWQGFSVPEVKRLFTEAAPSGQLFGNIAAMDSQGRVAAYDTRRPGTESFAERLNRVIPPGVNAADSTTGLVQYKQRVDRSKQWNRIVFYSGLGLMTLLVAARLALMWDRARTRARTSPRTHSGQVVRRTSLFMCLALMGPVVNGQEQFRPQPAKGSNTLVIHTQARTAYSLADALELLKIQLQHVDTRIQTIHLDQVSSNQIASANYLVIFCPQPASVFSNHFLQAIALARQPVLWIGFGMDQLETFTRFGRDFEASSQPADSPATLVHYRGRQWQAPLFPWLPITMRTNSQAKILMSVVQDGAEQPVAWKSSNFTFFAAIPATETISFLFCDLLLDFYGIKEPPPSRVFIRIEDYSALSNHREFRRKADYLHSRGIPFMVAVIPAVRDPNTGEEHSFETNPDFVTALRYAQARGGRLVMHGYNHAWKNEPGEGHEFWDVPSDRPISGDNAGYTRERLEKGVRQMLRYGLFPLAWETPHYSASRATYSEIAGVFSTAVERIQLSDSTHAEKAVPLGITFDQHGRMIIPENLGYVRGPQSTNALDEIRARAEMLLQLRGATVGCHIHAFQPLSKLAALVELLGGLKRPFLNLGDLSNTVELNDTVLLTARATCQVDWKAGKVLWKAFNPAGQLLAEEQQTLPADGTLRHRGVGVYELFESGKNQSEVRKPAP